MIPTWLIHTFAVLGALNLLAFFAVVAWCVLVTVRAYQGARQFRQAAVALERLNQARMADEWVIREVADRMERVR